jgi:hypothetical protein
MLLNHSRARVVAASRHLPALFGVLCVALGMTVSLFSCSVQISSPSLASTITNAPPSDEYALAYRESFGLFDDIPEKSWKRMQHHARTYVQYYNSSHPTYHIDRTIKWYIENQEVGICIVNLYNICTSASLGFVNGNRPLQPNDTRSHFSLLVCFIILYIAQL